MQSEQAEKPGKIAADITAFMPKSLKECMFITNQKAFQKLKNISLKPGDVVFIDEVNTTMIEWSSSQEKIQDIFMPTRKMHYAEIDPELTYCGKCTATDNPAWKISNDLITADLEKVTCKSCIQAYEKLLGITPNLLFPYQDLYWSKITCEEDCGSLAIVDMELAYPDSEEEYEYPKTGCTVTATANPLVRIFRLGMDDMVIVPLFI